MMNKLVKLLDMFDKLLEKFEKKLSKVKLAQANLGEPEICLQDCINV